MTFGEKIKDLRKEKKVTQRKLAEDLGIDFAYLSRIENGKLDTPPSEDLIRRMAALLGANEEELLDLAGRFDPKTLLQKAANVPEVGVLLRRIQNTPDDKLTPKTLKLIQDILDLDQ